MEGRASYLIPDDVARRVNPQAFHALYAYVARAVRWCAGLLVFLENEDSGPKSGCFFSRRGPGCAAPNHNDVRIRLHGLRVPR